MQTGHADRAEPLPALALPDCKAEQVQIGF